MIFSIFVANTDREYSRCQLIIDEGSALNGLNTGEVMPGDNLNGRYPMNPKAKTYEDKWAQYEGKLK